MSSLEAPAFLIGLSGLVPLVEKSLQLWQSIAEAKEFGNELMRIVAQLNMELFRFIAFARVSGVFELQSTPTSKSTQAASVRFPFSDDLGGQLQAPVENAAAQVVAILAEIAEIAQKYKLRSGTAYNSSSISSDKSTSLAVGLSTVLPIFGAKLNTNLTALTTTHRETGAALQEKTPFRLRFTFTSKPWGQPDQVALKHKVKELSYWNDRLERLLPHAVQQSLTNQALPGQILIDENKGLLETLIKATEHQNEAVKTHAKLWKERITFIDASQPDNAELEKYRRSASALTRDHPGPPSPCELSLTTFTEGQQPPIIAVVEWYSFGGMEWSKDDIKIATSRIAQLVHLAALKDRPPSLRVLNSICFVEKADSLGFVTYLPESADHRKHPISLHSLLSKNADVVVGFRPPSLEQRFLLAQQLASSVYSFGLVRWYHKDINSRNIVFLRDMAPGAKIMLDSPYVTGFSISRPDNNTEKSLSKDLEARSIYLHPDLRVTDPERRPRYHLKYEIYSLGLLLFEIGIWNTIEKAVRSGLLPKEFKDKAVDRCIKDLPFFVGIKYRNVVQWCLTCADDGADESDNSLDAMYWSVVLELAKCR